MHRHARYARRGRATVPSVASLAAALALAAAPRAAPEARATVRIAAGAPDTVATARLSRADLDARFPGLKRGACPLPGMLTAGQPDSAGLARITAAGYRTVLDLRTNAEARGFPERRVARALGLEYVNLPVGHTYVTAGQVRRLRALLADPARWPVAVHCASGNRVGALLLPWLVLDRGIPLDEAVRLAEDSGLRGPRLRATALRIVERERRRAAAR